MKVFSLKHLKFSMTMANCLSNLSALQVPDFRPSLCNRSLDCSQYIRFSDSSPH